MKKTKSFENIPLSEITISDTNPRKLYDFKKLDELSKSIIENGVIQPILVRVKNDKFELVCGERRFKASLKANLKTIPSYVRELSDLEVGQIQLIENLERENVHPYNEAIAYKKLLVEFDYTIDMLAIKLAKSKKYITQRLQLTSLVNQWKDYFLENGTKVIGQMLIIAKFSEELQIDLLEHAFDYSDNLRTAKELNAFVNSNFINSLVNTSFSLEEENLNDQAPKCTDCNNRTGANKSLFNHIDKDDRCTNSPCYEIKVLNSAYNNIKTIIESNEPILYITNGKPSQKIDDLLKDYKISVYKQYDHFYNTSDDEEENYLKAVWVNGSDIGKVVFVRLKENSDSGVAKKKAADCTPTELIEKIELREIRSKELDAEKVHAKIVDSLQSSEDFNVVGKLENCDLDITLMRLNLLQSADYYLKEEFIEDLKLKHVFNYKSTAKSIFKELNNLTENQMAFINRKLFFAKNKGHLPNTTDGKVFRAFAELFKDVSIKEYESEQKEICKARNNRIKDKIKDLKKKITD